MKVDGELLIKILTGINSGTILIILICSLTMNPPYAETNSPANNDSVSSFLFTEETNNSMVTNNSTTGEIKYGDNTFDNIYWPLFSACFFAACFLSLLYFSFYVDEKICDCCSCCDSAIDKNDEKVLAAGAVTCCCGSCLCSEMCCCCCKNRGRGCCCDGSGGSSCSSSSGNCDCSGGGGEGAAYACLLIVFLFILVLLYFWSKDLGKSISRKVGYIFQLLFHGLFIYLSFTYDIKEQIVFISYIAIVFGIIGVLTNIFAILFSFSALKCCITVDYPSYKDSDENLISNGKKDSQEDIPPSDPQSDNNYISGKTEIELSPYDTNQG